MSIPYSVYIATQRDKQTFVGPADCNRLPKLLP